VEGLLSPFDFRLAIGGDGTDEDLFEQLPRGAWTIHVGDGPSRARFRVEDPVEAHRVLARLVKVGPPMETVLSTTAAPVAG
jgi:trehalose-6-phosphatase